MKLLVEVTGGIVVILNKYLKVTMLIIFLSSPASNVNAGPLYAACFAGCVAFCSVAADKAACMNT